MEFFIIDRNGQQAGPFSFDQLVQKGISPETLVWKQGMADWTPAWKVEDLRAVLEAVEANQSNQNTQKQEANQQQAHQQDYQKAQQEAYQQGFQQGAAMHSNFQQQSKKKTSHFAIKMVIVLIIFILAIFAITNPSADAHKEKVRTEASKAVEKAVGPTDNNFFSQALRSVAKMMAGSMMDEAITSYPQASRTTAAMRISVLIPTSTSTRAVSMWMRDCDSSISTIHCLVLRMTSRVGAYLITISRES